ncbi:MAG: hypothetical protein OXC48_08110 [Endozoicomonadaceae bacterium]|nr:hypothetical protein [Endozoicomonadaceae bacterium]
MSFIILFFRNSTSAAIKGYVQNNLDKLRSGKEKKKKYSFRKVLINYIFRPLVKMTVVLWASTLLASAVIDQHKQICSLSQRESESPFKTTNSLNDWNDPNQQHVDEAHDYSVKYTEVFDDEPMVRFIATLLTPVISEKIHKILAEIPAEIPALKSDGVNLENENDHTDFINEKSKVCNLEKVKRILQQANA